MADRLELTINRWLREGVTSEAIAERLLSRLWNGPDRDDSHTIAQFVLHARLPHKLLEACEDLLRQDRFIPWSGLIEALAQVGTTPTPELIEIVLEGARAQSGLEDLLLSFHWDNLSPQLALARKPVLEARAQRLQRIVEELYRKLEFYKSHGLIEKEKVTFDILERLHAGLPQLEVLRQDLNERFARHIISKSNLPQHPSFDGWADGKQAHSHSEWLNTLSAEISSLMKQFPHLAFDLISVLLSMDFMESAAKVSPALPEGRLSEWLKIDIYMRADQHLNALSLLDGLAERQELGPEEAFALAYLKSQALWALGQKQGAIEILSHLVQIRPQFQQASHLLQLWQGTASP